MERPLGDLLAHLPSHRLSCAGLLDPQRIPVQRIVCDSREVQPGDLFVAIVGRRSDGHHFLSDTVAQGVAAAVGTRAPGELAARGIHLPAHLPYIQVDDSRAALATLSAALYGFPSRDMAVVGVTGTDGKTTTCTLLEAILVEATGGPANGSGGAVGVVTTIGARIRGQATETGLHVTTPQSPQVQAFLAQMRDEGCRYAIMESTSHGLDQRRVDAVDFDVAAVTNVTHEHLDEHGNLDGYLAAKARLFRALFRSQPKPAIPRLAVLNRDDPISFPALQQVLEEERSRSEMDVRVRCYGLLPTTTAPVPDVGALDIVYRPDSTSFRLAWWGGEFPMETRLVGEFNVYNILCAATVALDLGVAPAAVQSAVARVEGIVGRMERIDRGQPFLAVVDFAHSPASLERALTVLRPLVGQDTGDGDGRLIAVFGSAGLRDQAKRRLMGRVSGRLADFTIVTAEDPRTEDLEAINREIVAGLAEFAAPGAYIVVPDRAEAIRQAVVMARPGDVVAAFGKGHERSMCFGETEYPWSDQQAMGDALVQRLA